MHARNRNVIHISPHDEPAINLCVAERRRQTVLIDDGYFIYEVQVVSATDARDARRAAGEPDSILNIIGMGKSSEPTNIAKHKDEYIADAIMPRKAESEE